MVEDLRTMDDGIIKTMNANGRTSSSVKERVKGCFGKIFAMVSGMLTSPFVAKRAALKANY